jgi:hypothetical protein
MLTVRGYIWREFAGQRDAFVDDVSTWIAEGRVRQLADTLQPALPQKSAGTTSLRNEMSARCLGAARRVGLRQPHRPLSPPCSVC